MRVVARLYNVRLASVVILIARLTSFLLSDDDLSNWGKRITQLKVDKSIIGWDLQALEDAINRTQEDRESDSDDE